MEKPYRTCVVGVFTDLKNRILVGERSDISGAFQLPQGGIEESESPEIAILREMAEELGESQFSIIKSSESWTYYDFPEALKSKVAEKYRGQKQMWFLLKFDREIDIKSLVGDGEFSRFEWKDAKTVVNDIVSWKKEAYVRGLKQLGLWKG